MYTTLASFVKQPVNSSDNLTCRMSYVGCSVLSQIMVCAHAGNASYTMITRSFAARLQLVDENGRPRQSNVRMTTVRGAVAGASEQVPLMSLSYELRGGNQSSSKQITNLSCVSLRSSVSLQGLACVGVRQELAPRNPTPTTVMLLCQADV